MRSTDWTKLLKAIKGLANDHQLTSKKVFISYAWEGDSTATSWLHTRLIRIRDDLLKAGCISVFLDVSEMTGDITEMMNKELTNCDVVLVICTPRYATRITDTKTNIGYEYQQTLKKQTKDSGCVYPLWLAGGFQEAVPAVWQALTVYDFRDPFQHELQLSCLREGQGILPRLLGVLPEQKDTYQALWQSYHQVAYTENDVPNLLTKLQTKMFSQYKDSEIVMLHPFICATGDASASIGLVKWISKTPSRVNLVLEENTEYRTAHWQAIFPKLWFDAQASGIIPVYISLTSIASGSTDLIHDWLTQQKFSTEEINALQHHYRFVFILAGFETRIRQGHSNILSDAKWQRWKGDIVILCKMAQAKEAQFIDDYLNIQGMPVSQSFTIQYSKLEMQADISPAFPVQPSRRLVFQPHSRKFDAEVAIQAPELTPKEVQHHWQSFLKVAVNPLAEKHLIFISQANGVKIKNRIELLTRYLTQSGFTLTKKLSQSQSVLVIATPEYVAAIQEGKQTDYLQIQKALANQTKAVYPLWYMGDSFINSVPSELCKFLVRDFRDEKEDIWNLGALESPLGLLPALLAFNSSVLKQKYQQQWEILCKRIWGEQVRPSNLLTRLQIASQQQLAEESLYQQTRDYYQAPALAISKESDAIENFDEFRTRLLMQAQSGNGLHPVFALLGEGGTGKSMNLFRLEEALWAEFYRHHLVPLRINLSQINPKKDFVKERLQEVGYSKAEIMRLHELYTFIFLFDGFDELVFQHGLQGDILNTAHVRDWRGLTLLSCRTILENEIISLRINERRYLCPFTPKQIDAYLSAQANEHPELTANIRANVYKLPGLVELISNPLLLYITTNILPELVEDQATSQQALTRYRLYELFTDKWFQREFVRIVTEGALQNVDTQGFHTQWKTQLFLYAERIASLMFQHQTLQINADQLDEQAKAYLAQVLALPEDNQAIAILRNACPLKSVGEDCYQFVHKTFQEFLSAQWLWKLAKIGDHANPVTNAINRLQYHPIQNERAILQFLDDAWQALPNVGLRENLRTLLLEVVERSKRHSRIAQSSSNAATWLNAMGERLNGLDWRGVQLPGADLSYGRLWETDLSGANLKEAYVAHTIFINAKLVGANMKGLRIGERPKILAETCIFALALHPNNRWIAVAQNNNIMFYDISTGQLMNVLFEGHTDSVQSVAFSFDGQLLASSGRDSTCRLWRVSDQTPYGKSLEGHTGEVTTVAFSPNGQLLASGSTDHTCRLWRVSDQTPYGRILKRHTGAVQGVVFSPNGQLLASSSNDHTCRLWRVSDQTPYGKILEGHSNSVHGVAFSPDGQLLASGSSDKTCRLWRVSDQTPYGKILEGHTSWIESVAFSSDGQLLASGSWDNTCHLWRVSDQTPYGKPFEGHTSSVSNVVFSLDGQLLISGAVDSTCRLWEISEQPPVGKPFIGHSSAMGIYSLVFSPDGQLIASGSSDATCRLWQASNQTPCGKLGVRLEELGSNRPYIASVSFSPDGQLLALGSDTTCRLWRVSDQTPYGKILEGHTRSVSSVVFSPDGQLLASGSYDHTCRLWRVSDQTPYGKILEGHTRSVSSVVFSPDGQLLASGSNDHTCRLWCVSDQTPYGKILEGHSSSVYGIAFSPDGQLLASGSFDKTCRLWRVSDQTPYGKILEGHTRCVSSVVFSPGGQLLASGSWDNTCRLWRVSDQTPYGKILEGHTSSVEDIAFSPNGQLLASGSNDRTCRLWRVSDQTLYGKPLEGHGGEFSCVAFSPNGQLLASGSSDCTSQLWQVSNQTFFGKALENFNSHTTVVSSVAFNPDGRLLASGSHDNTCRLWRLEDQANVGNLLRGHTKEVTSVAFSPDGRLLASGSFDKTCRLWRVSDQTPYGKLLAGHTGKVTTVAFSPNGQLLASGSWDNTCRLWRVSDQTSYGKPLEGHTKRVNSVVFSPNGQLLASSSYDDTCRLWRISDQTAYGKVLKGHLSSVDGVAFSFDGKLLASVSRDSTCRLWKVADQTCLRTLSLGYGANDWQRINIRSVAFAPRFGSTENVSCGAYRLAWGDDLGFITVWRLEGEQLTPSMEGMNVASNTPLSLGGATLTGCQGLSHLNKVVFEQSGANVESVESSEGNVRSSGHHTRASVDQLATQGLFSGKGPSTAVQQKTPCCMIL